jgi:hypothetical protein
MAENKSSGFISFCAFAVSLTALGSSLYDGYQNRKHMRITQLPAMYVGWGINDINGLYITAENRGNGIAVIKRMIIKLDNKEIDSWDGVASVTRSKNPVFSMVWPGDYMRPSGDNIYRTLFSSKNYESHAIALAGLKRINVEICYCSVYDDCKITSFSESTEVSYSVCDKPSNLKLPDFFTGSQKL